MKYHQREEWDEMRDAIQKSVGDSSLEVEDVYAVLCEARWYECTMSSIFFVTSCVWCVTLYFMYSGQWIDNLLPLGLFSQDRTSVEMIIWSGLLIVAVLFASAMLHVGRRVFDYRETLLALYVCHPGDLLKVLEAVQEKDPLYKWIAYQMQVFLESR